MLTSLALIFIFGLLLSSIAFKLKLPGLIGFILSGILLGPYVFNLLDPSLLHISADLRKLALIIILIRAGLSLNLSDLKKIGRPAVLLCFIPACFEIAASILLAPRLLGLSYLESALLGSVIAAVSPAVVIPRMIRLMEEERGTDKKIPQLIMAGAAVDDVFVIVIFTSFLSFAEQKTASLDAAAFIQVPVSIIFGIIVGAATGTMLTFLFKKIHMRDTVKVLIILSLSFLFQTLENSLSGSVAFSGLIAVISCAITIYHQYPLLSSRLSGKFNRLWAAAEILLFALVGAAIDMQYAFSTGLYAIIFIFLCLIFRMAGVFFCLIKTHLTSKERLFCAAAYTPKATVQAAIGSVPLAAGLACGNLILCCAVVSIIITAPLGAAAIDHLARLFLKQNRTTNYHE